MMSATLAALALALYLTATVCSGAVMFLGAAAAPTRSAGSTSFPAARYSRPLLIIGILIHFLSIGAFCIQTHRSPFAGEYGTLSVTAWAIGIAYLLLDIRGKLMAVGALALTVACLILFSAILHVGGPVTASQILTSRVVSLHVMAILASYGLFVLAFGCAALYLLQNQRLKEHKAGGMFRRLPPLTTLDSVAYHAVAYALPLLTIGLGLGIAYGVNTHLSTSKFLADPHTIVSIVTWLLYVLYLSARLVFGWRGVRLQYILLLGLPIALALYAIPSSIHQFG
jgi:ABC-type uncharacterized transport system permease subunit